MQSIYSFQRYVEKIRDALIGIIVEHMPHN